MIAGRNGGTWDGQGIMSSLADESSGIAVGYTDDGDPNGPVRALRTYQGDATCDGAVNIYDLIKLQVNYNGTGLNWDDADWTYDGVCNIYDLIKLQVNYGKPSLGPFGAGGGGAPVPEPAGLAETTTQTSIAEYGSDGPPASAGGPDGPVQLSQGA